MKIAVRRGHQRTGKDGCAVGILNEIDVANAYYSLLMAKLKALGHQVLDVTPPEANRSLHDSLFYGINKANNWGAELFISCHANKAYNSYNGSMGCEVLYHKNSDKSKDYATKVERELVNIGFKSRGAKADVRGLAEINNTKCPCIIIEPFFLEATEDVALYKKVGAEGLANAIVKGITGQSVTQQPTQSTTKSNSFINIDGGGYATYNDSKSGINLIIKDYSDDIMRAFAYVDNDKNASWSFDLVPPNSNYEKLSKGCNKVVTVRNGGYTFCKGSIYKIRIDGYNKEYKKVCSTTIALKIPN